MIKKNLKYILLILGTALFIYGLWLCWKNGANNIVYAEDFYDYIGPFLNRLFYLILATISLAIAICLFNFRYSKLIGILAVPILIIFIASFAYSIGENDETARMTTMINNYNQELENQYSDWFNQLSKSKQQIMQVEMNKSYNFDSKSMFFVGENSNSQHKYYIYDDRQVAEIETNNPIGFSVAPQDYAAVFDTNQLRIIQSDSNKALQWILPNDKNASIEGASFSTDPQKLIGVLIYDLEKTINPDDVSAAANYIRHSQGRSQEMLFKKNAYFVIDIPTRQITFYKDSDWHNQYLSYIPNPYQLDDNSRQLNNKKFLNDSLEYFCSDVFNDNSPYVINAYDKNIPYRVPSTLNPSETKLYFSAIKNGTRQSAIFVDTDTEECNAQLFYDLASNGITGTIQSLYFSDENNLLFTLRPIDSDGYAIYDLDITTNKATLLMQDPSLINLDLVNKQ